MALWDGSPYRRWHDHIPVYHPDLTLVSSAESRRSGTGDPCSPPSVERSAAPASRQSAARTHGSNPVGLPLSDLATVSERHGAGKAGGRCPVASSWLPGLLASVDGRAREPSLHIARVSLRLVTGLLAADAVVAPSLAGFAAGCG